MSQSALNLFNFYETINAAAALVAMACANPPAADSMAPELAAIEIEDLKQALCNYEDKQGRKLCPTEMTEFLGRLQSRHINDCYACLRRKRMCMIDNVISWLENNGHFNWGSTDVAIKNLRIEHSTVLEELQNHLRERYFANLK